MPHRTKFFLVVLFLFALAVPYGAAKASDTVIVKVGSTYAVVDGTGSDLQAAPAIVDGTTLVPLRFMAEAFGTDVFWNAGEREITLRQDSSVIKMKPGTEKVIINGEAKTISEAPVVENSVVLVPLRFLVESLNFQVSFKPATKEIHINRLPPPNQPPVAEFTVLNDTIAQGETVYYTDKSYDPEGDQLVAESWTGKERAFFVPGEYEVSLQVKDSKGAWSESYTRVITVTDKVKMDELAYNLDNPLPGQPLNVSDIPVLDYRTLNPVVITNKEKVMISNSPETVLRDGVLFSDTLNGDNRLYYHHLNGSSQTKGIYVLAVNREDEPVRLNVKRWGTAGPADPISVGRAAAYRYLDFSAIDARSYELQPGEWMVVNEGAANAVKPNQAVHGMFDVHSNGDLQFLVVAVGSRQQLAAFEKLPVLARDGKHIGGTFLRANRNVAVRLNVKEPTRLVVADGEEDRFLYGKDGETLIRNKGNYGLSYKVFIQSQYRVGVLFSPRGGVFGGAGAWEGEAFNLPNQGVMQPGGLAMIGVVEPGQEKVLEFIPPAGSFLPVNLIFIPF